MAPESNQQSITSGTRCISPPHFGHFTVISSIYGLCSSTVRAAGLPLICSSSSRLPMACIWPHPHSQTFRGVPQYRLREIPQSWIFSSQSPKRPFPMDSGIQWMVLLLRIKSSFTAVILINQDSLA